MGRITAFVFSPEGALLRGPLFVAWAGQGIAALAMVAIAIFIIDPAEDDPSTFVVAIEGTLFVIYLLCVAASAYLGIRRLRQRGMSGWWCLVCLVPVVGPPWYLREVLRGGDEARNGPPR